MSRLQRRRRQASLEWLEDRQVPATITVAPVTVAETAAATGAVFKATLAAASAEPITLTYTTSNGSAHAGRDFVATRSTVTIPAGQTSATLTIPLKATTVSGRADETFVVNLSDGTGNTVTRHVAATLVDDLPSPTVTASDAVVTAKGKGTTRTYVTVTLSNPSAKLVKVDYSTVAAAKSSTVTVATTGAVTIRPGTTTARIPVTITATPTVAQSFNVDLTGATGATIPTATPGTQFARVVVLPTRTTTTLPVLSVSNPTLIAGQVADFTVTLSAAATVPVSFRYSMPTTSANTGIDNILTIPAGATTEVIAVPTAANTGPVSFQQIKLDLTSPANATLAAKTATATIIDPGPLPTLTAVGSTTAATPPTPGAGGGTVDFTVNLSNAYILPVTVNYATADGSAVAGTNYTATSGTLTFAPGVTSLTVPVTLLPGMSGPPTANQTINLVLSSPSEATIATGTATATITAPTGGGGTPPGGTPIGTGLTVGGSQAVVGTTGTATLTYAVTLSAASTSTVTVAYATADNSAVAGTDYTAASGTLTFAPGVTTQTVNVTVFGEATTAANKTFTLNLTNATNATITSNAATGEIIYATSTPTLSVAPASASVGTSGSSPVTFTVSLSSVSANAVTVNYATSDGTAVAGTDYTATSGTLTFAPGTTSQTVTVTALGESSTVATKTFNLNLSGASNTTNATATAVGTINETVIGQQTDLSDNLADTSGGTETATGSTVVATSFTTGVASVTLNRLTLLLDQATAGQATVSLYSDGGLQPGTLLGTLTSPATISTSLANTTFTSAAGIPLTANTTYWVVLSAPTGSFNWSWTATDTGAGTGFTDTWAESSDGGTTWFAYDSSPPQMGVIATTT